MSEMTKEKIWAVFMELPEDEQAAIANFVFVDESKFKILHASDAELFLKRQKLEKNQLWKITEGFNKRHIWARWDRNILISSYATERALLAGDDLVSLLYPYAGEITDFVKRNWDCDSGFPKKPEHWEDYKKLFEDKIKADVAAKKEYSKDLENRILKNVRGLEEAGTFTWVRMLSQEAKPEFVCADWEPQKAISSIRAHYYTGHQYRDAKNPRWIHEIFEVQGFYLRENFTVDDVNKSFASAMGLSKVPILVSGAGQVVQAESRPAYFLPNSVKVQSPMRSIRYDDMNDMFCKY